MDSGPAIGPRRNVIGRSRLSFLHLDFARALSSAPASVLWLMAQAHPTATLEDFELEAPLIHQYSLWKLHHPNDVLLEEERQALRQRFDTSRVKEYIKSFEALPPLTPSELLLDAKHDREGSLRQTLETLYRIWANPPKRTWPETLERKVSGNFDRRMSHINVSI